MNDIIKSEEQLAQLPEAELAKLYEMSGRLLSDRQNALRNEGIKQIEKIAADCKLTVVIRGHRKPKVVPNSEAPKVYEDVVTKQRWTDDGTSKMPKFLRDWKRSGKPISDLEVPASAQTA